MKNFKVSALALLVCFLSILSCTKTDDTAAPFAAPVDNTKASTVIDGSRIRIHFGTATQNGCMYSFSNCIWIGWGTEATSFERSLAVTFDHGDAAGQYFGAYFPLTADYTVDAVAAKSLGIPEQVIPAGFYPFRDVSTGQATGKRMVVFSPESALKTQALVNPKNPQDNIGQLHNLAAQVILNDNREALQQLRGDKAAIQQFVTAKAIQFLAEAELPVEADAQRRVYALDLNGDYTDLASLLDKARLSDNDKKTLRPIFNEATAIPVSSPETLGKFLSGMTAYENRLATAKLDDPKMVLSALSVLKYSRYFWFWKAYSAPTPTTSDVAGSARIPAWVIADVKEWLQNGDLVSTIVASVKTYLDTH